MGDRTDKLFVNVKYNTYSKPFQQVISNHI